MKKSLQIFTILILVLTCSCSKDKDKPSAELNYTKAVKKLKNKDFSSAAEDFEKISDEYPLSKWGIKAQPMAAYCFYKEEKLADVVRVSEEFIKNNPSNPDVAYMQYLKSIAYYDQMNDIDRAQDNARSASSAFRELIARFSNSEYTKDAREKLVLVDEHIAGAKMAVGRYQLQSGNYIGAIKNFQDVVNNFTRTNQTPEAYFRLFEAHQKLGLTSSAEDYRQTLNQTYPDNKWTGNSE